jgi:hypothetical protein
MDLLFSTILTIFIVIGVTVFIILKILSTFGWLFTVIVGPLIGAFVGVFLGFKINNDYRKRQDNGKKQFYLSSLRHEIDKGMVILQDIKHDDIMLIPENVWNSIMNTGNITLFANQEAIPLSSIYFEIQNYNFEAKKAREALAFGQVAYGKDFLTSEQGKELCENLVITKDNLLKKLKNFHDEWFKL